MGRLFTVDFEFAPGQSNRHYRCRTCFDIYNDKDDPDITQIALLSNRLVGTFSNGKPAMFFTKVYNVITGKPDSFINTDGVPFTRADLYCIRCDTHIGWKCFFNKQEAPNFEATYILFRTKMDGWDGDDRVDPIWSGPHLVCM